MKAPPLGKPMQFVVLVVIFAVGIVLWYSEARGTLSQPIRILLPIAYFALAVFLSRKLGLQFPEHSDGPFLHIPVERERGFQRIVNADSRRTWTRIPA
jgi:hypothetical protein